jgi:acyl-CoA hydrolase
MVNVIWGLFNLAVGYLLFRAGRVFGGDVLACVVFFAGIAAISVMSSVNFAKKQTE